MPDVRETLDDAPPTGPVDVARVRELSAVADAKALDPTTPPYNPTDHVPPRRRSESPTTPGLTSPVLLDLSTRVHAASVDRFQARVGGTSDAANGGTDATDGRGELHEDDRRPEVPCADLRPRGVDEVDGSADGLIESDVDAITSAQANLAEVLRESGDELSAEDVQEALQYVNPTDGRQNCVECAMAVDDLLDGRPAVAGPTPSQPPYQLRSALSARSNDYLENVTSTEVERLLHDAGSGARGIVVGWQNQAPVHAYNAANIEGDVYWLDGQQDLMTEHDPHGFRSLELYLTGTEGEQ